MRDPSFGHIFDHHAIVFEYASGQKVFSFCRQMPGCESDVSDHVMGTAGNAELQKHIVEPKGGKKWKFEGAMPSMYQCEHNELFAAIRAGKVINDGEFMAQSTLMAIMGRMATYTGQKVTWEKALASKEDLTPAVVEFKATAAEPPVARPGKTKLI